MGLDVIRDREDCERVLDRFSAVTGAQEMGEARLSTLLRIESLLQQIAENTAKPARKPRAKAAK